MKTGLPRQATVRRWPTAIGARSTSVVESASVSRAGFRLSINGQIEIAAPMPPSAPAVSSRKSRRDRQSRLILLTTGGAIPLHRFNFAAGDTLLLGRESAGVPAFVHEAAFARIVIPMQAGARSL